jgi:FMN reductase
LYAPERPERTELAGRLCDAVRACDGLIIATPGYHGTISGLVKNALDYLEDLSHDERPYLAERPVGVVATGAGWQGVVAALEHMRTVVHALRGWPTPLGAGINSTLPVFGPDGAVIDDKVRFQLETVAAEVLWFVRTRSAAAASG